MPIKISTIPIKEHPLPRDPLIMIEEILITKERNINQEILTRETQEDLKNKIEDNQHIKKDNQIISNLVLDLEIKMKVKAIPKEHLQATRDSKIEIKDLTRKEMKEKVI